MNMKLDTFLVITLTLGVFMSCQSIGQQSYDKTFEDVADNFYSKVVEDFGSVASASIAIVKGDEVEYTAAFGTADRSKQLKASPETAYYIASSTKSFTALLAAILDEEKVISLSDPLTKFFPETQFDPALKADQITMEHLITHTSGLSNGPISFRSAYSGDHNFKKLVDLLNASRQNNAGFDNFQYTNVGYNIYTLVTEKVTGKPWQQLLEEKIFNPLGMDHTTAYISKAKKKKWSLAKPYAGVNKDDIREVYLMKKDNTMQSAGGLITTSADMLAWLKVQLNKGELDGKRIFSKAIMERGQSILANASEEREEFKGEGYGYGWNVGKYGKEKVVWHFGGFPGFFTHVSFLPDQNIGVVVMVNDAAAGYRLMNLFAYYAYDYLMGKEGTEEKYWEKATNLKERLGQRAEKMKAHEADRAKREWQLTESFKNYSGTFTNDLYGTLKVKGDTKQIKVEMGNMHCVAEPYVKENTIRVELIPMRGEILEFKMKDGKVTGIQYDDVFFEKSL